MKLAVATILTLSSASAAIAAQPTTAPSRRLPDPFRMDDGHRVATAEEWQRRRLELREHLQADEYGHQPPAPDALSVERSPMRPQVSKVSWDALNITVTRGGRSIVMHAKLAVPPGTAGRVPVVVRPNYGPNRKPAWAPADPDSDAGMFLARGYAVAEFPITDVAPDKAATARTGGVYQLYGADIDCGTLMAWAWSFSRMVDALVQQPDVDPAAIATSGHSRFGKAALLAAAFDERIALANPSHSGCGGTGSFRFPIGKCETLDVITERFPYWFRPDFSQRFAHREPELSTDQHELWALVAPRATLATEGTQDEWSNPNGVQLNFQAARVVYDFLTATDKVAVRYRDVGHVPNDGDLLDFADHVFRGKPLPPEFNRLPYPPIDPPAFSWGVPGVSAEKKVLP